MPDNAEEWVSNEEELAQLRRDFQEVQAEPYPLPPPEGWLPKDFPHLSFDHVPYSTNAMPRADPYMTITKDGWLYVEAGNTRLAIPDEEEWQKFVYMVTCLWNAWTLQQQANNPDEGEETDDRSSPDPGSDTGQDAPADHGERSTRDEAGTPSPSDPESG